MSSPQQTAVLVARPAIHRDQGQSERHASSRSAYHSAAGCQQPIGAPDSRYPSGQLQHGLPLSGRHFGAQQLRQARASSQQPPLTLRQIRPGSPLKLCLDLHKQRTMSAARSPHQDTSSFKLSCRRLCMSDSNLTEHQGTLLSKGSPRAQLRKGLTAGAHLG